MAREKVILAYSGGLDTSVAVKWIDERYDMDVVTYTCDLGQGRDMEAIRASGLRLGADPMGGSGVAYWEPIALRYGLDITVVNPEVEETVIPTVSSSVLLTDTSFALIPLYNKSLLTAGAVMIM